MDARGGARSGEARRIHPRIGIVAVWVMWLAACGGEPTTPGARTATLLPLDTALLAPQSPVELRLVEGEGAPVLELTGGRLPSGLELGDGVIRGVPRRPGEHRRFEITARGHDLSVRDRRVYALTVGMGGGLVSLTAGVEHDGDAVHVVRTFTRPADQAILFDPGLGLAWPLPMQAGAEARGAGLASPSGSLQFLVNGPGWSQGWLVPGVTLDDRVITVVQLVWDADEAVDFDLQLVPETVLGLAAVDAEFPVLARDELWLARRSLASDREPGSEGLVLSADLPPGRYALVAVRAGGDASVAELWVAVRDRSGTLAIDERFIAFVPDISSGSLATDLAERRQSWRALGHLSVTDGGAATYGAPVQGRLFPPDAPL